MKDLSVKSFGVIGRQSRVKTRFYTIIIHNGSDIKLGAFDTEQEAALAYDKYVRENNLNRRLNFPDPEPENLIPNTRLIRLTNGKFAVVDEEDFNELNKYNWAAVRSRKSNLFYARRHATINGRHTSVAMHQQILGFPDHIIDHEDRDGLNNRKSNFRKCTSNQNGFNTSPHKRKKGVTSVFKGVCKGRDRKKFTSIIRINGKRIYLGQFKDEIEAAKSYDAKARELFGEFAYLNFPDNA